MIRLIKKLFLVTALGLLATKADAATCTQYFGYAQQGGSKVTTQSAVSTTKVQRSFPGSFVNVYSPGTTTNISIYSDSGCSTPLGNPLTAGSDASVTFYTTTTPFDLKFSGPGITTICGSSGQLPCIPAFTWPNQVTNSTGSTGVSVFPVGDGKFRNDGVVSGTSLTSVSASFASTDQGKTVLIYRAGAASADFTTTIASVTNATTVVLTGSAPTVIGANASFYWGTDYTSAIQAAITALPIKAVVNVGSGLYVYTDTTPALKFPEGIYLLTGELNLTGHATFNAISDAHAILVQTDQSKRIFYTTDGYQMLFEGLQFFGGKYAIDFEGPNDDNSFLTIQNCSFQLQEAYSIYTVASIASATTRPEYHTGTITTNGTTTVAGSGTAWADANQGLWNSQFFGDLHITSGPNADQWFKVAEVTTPTNLFSNRAIGAAGGQAYSIGDYHLSTKLLIFNCDFFNVAAVLFNNCDEARVENSWVELFGTSVTTFHGKFKADSAAFRNMNGSLLLEGMFGVPVMGTVGVDRLTFPRWVDQESSGYVYITNRSRIGGEYAGMAVVRYMSPFGNAAPFYSGSGVIIENSTVFAGPHNDNPAYVGVIILSANGTPNTDGRENIPRLIRITGNDSQGDGSGLASGPYVNNEASVDINNFINHVSSIERKLRYQIGPNSSDTLFVGLTGTWNGAQRSISLVRFLHDYTFTSSVAWTGPNLAATTCQSQTFNVPGVQDGDGLVAQPVAAIGLDLFTYRAFTSTNDTGLVTGVVTIRLCNPTAGAVAVPATGNWTVYVSKPKWQTDTP